MTKIHRRHMLGLVAAAGMAPALARAATPPRTSVVRARGAGNLDYSAAMASLGDYAQRELDSWGLPGMTLAAVDADGFTAIMTFGWADVERRLPVTPAHLFQIGSISKSFAAITLFALADAGKLSLDAPLGTYLPDAPLPPEPITVAQTMSHTAGLPDGAPIFPRTPDGRLWCGFAPGSRFSYSNTGYALFGPLIGALEGAPHPDVIRRRVFEPLGMNGAEPVISDTDRARYAVGYAPLIASRPFVTGAPLTPGPWTDLDLADGSIAATPDDMAAYVRYLIRLGSGDGGPILSDAAARRMATPVIAAKDFGLEARYGFGFATVPVGGKPCLHHTGGMLTFSSSFHADSEAGVACFASVNAQLGNDYRPRLVTAYAVELMRAVRAHAAAPAAPDAWKSRRVESPGDYIGRYAAADGTTLEIAAADRGLVLIADGKHGRLEPDGEHGLLTDHPLYASHRLDFVAGAAPSFWWKDTLFGKGTVARQPAAPADLAALAGRYTSHDPWAGEASVYARGDRLVIEGLGTITKRPDGYWALAEDPGAIERFRFEGPLNGRPRRLSFSGVDLLRTT